MGVTIAVSLSGRQDLGKNLEILTFLRLKQSCRHVYCFNSENGGEVDFVTMDGVKITPYQVSLDGAKPRHDKA